MFIKTHTGTTLVNTAHIVSVGISSPMYEQKDYCVTANLVNGTVVLFRGTMDACRMCLDRIMEEVNKR